MRKGIGGVRSGGILQFPDERRFEWKWRGTFLRNRWVWASPSGAILMRVSSGGRVDIEQGAAEHPELPLLVLLGWYLLNTIDD